MVPPPPSSDQATKPIVTVAWTKDNGGIPSQPNLKSNPSTKLIVWFRDGRPSKKGASPRTRHFFWSALPHPKPKEDFSLARPLEKAAQCPVYPWIDSLVDWMNFRFRLSLFSSQMVGLCEFSPYCPQRFMSVLSSWDPRFLDPNIYATTTSVLKSQNTIGNLGNRYECHHLSNSRFPDVRSCILCHILLQPAFDYSWVDICGLGVPVP